MKGTKNQIRQRIEEVLSIILQGGEISDIRNHAQEQGWKLSDGQLHRYQARAWDLMQERVERNRDRIFHRALLQRRLLLARAMEAGDFKTALATIKDEAALFGIYPGTVNKIALTDPSGTRPYDPANASEESRIQAIVELLEQGRAKAIGCTVEPTANSAAVVDAIARPADASVQQPG